MKKKTLLSIITLLAIGASTLIWEKVELPYNHQNQIYGEYAKYSYNPLNDSIRYILFISIPLISFFISYLIIYKKKLFAINQIIKANSDPFPNQNLKTINFFFYLICFLYIINFLTLDYNRYYFDLDFFHEGTYLTPTKNLQFTNNFWLSSYLDYGLLGNFFPIIFWKALNLETIGSARFFQLILLLFNKILLILLCKKISENLNLDKRIEIIYFVLISIFAASLVELDFRSSIIPGKFFLLLIFLYVFFESLKITNKLYIYNFVIGLLCSISIFCYLDIGIYLNVLLFFLITFLVYRSEYKKIFLIIAGYLSGLIFFYIFLSGDEINAFYENTKMLLSSIDYLDGLIYPTPFLSKDIRSTRALLFIIITGILIIIFNLDKRIKAKNELKIFFSFLFILNILLFKSAMMRSDSTHIKSSSGLLIFLLAVIVFYFLTLGIVKLLKENKLLTENLVQVKKIYLFIPLLILLINFTVISIYSMWYRGDVANVKNTIFSFSQINTLLKQNDYNYLSKDHLEMINYYKNLVEDEKCIQIFTNETAIPYLLKKPTCTNFYLMFISSTKENQKLFIKQLEDTKPKFILFHSEIDPYNETHDSMPIVLDYINKNYSFYDKLKFWTFVKIN